MAGAASLYRDRDRRLELAAQREANNSEMGHEKKLQINETMDWATNSNVPGIANIATRDASYERKRISGNEKF